MTLHYHGTPITPNVVLESLAGCHFCVSYAAPAQVQRCHEVGQSVMLDNGAFSLWRQGKQTDWEGYYEWCDRWLKHRTTWAVIPDVIDGTPQENNELIRRWPFRREQSAPVWHLDERLLRLKRLAEEWPRVCIGSSGRYSELDTPQWHQRMEQAMNALCENGPPPVWLHMLRGMAQVRGPYPFASVDSTDIARNHNRGGDALEMKIQRAEEMVRRWDRIQTPARWEVREQLSMGAV